MQRYEKRKSGDKFKHAIAFSLVQEQHRSNRHGGKYGGNRAHALQHSHTVQQHRKANDNRGCDNQPDLRVVHGKLRFPELRFVMTIGLCTLPSLTDRKEAGLEDA